MIRKAQGWYAVLLDMIPRLDLAHGDLSNMVGWLRDPAVEIWTLPGDGADPLPTLVGATEAERLPAPGAVRYFLETWRAHFAGERARLLQQRDAAATLQARFPEVYDQLADYAGTIPTVVQGLAQVLGAARYRTAQGVLMAGPVTTAHRAALADAIAPLLEV